MKEQKNPIDFFVKAAEKSGKPLEEFMQTDGKKLRDELMKNKQRVSQYMQWLKGEV